MKKIFVVLPVHNRLDSTSAFLDCMAKQTYANFEVVVCDDGSTDGTGDYIRRNYPEVVVLDGDGNLWWTAGINQCIEYVLGRCNESDYVLTINNDVRVGPDYLAQKAARAEKFPGCIIGSLCVYMDAPDLIETSGFTLDFRTGAGGSLTARGQRRTQEHTGVKPVTYLPGKGVLIPTALYKRIGLYDAQNFPQYHADADFTIRASKAGVCILVDFDSIVLSDINLKNMSVPDAPITLGGIIKTFRGPYSPNSFWVSNNFARKHFAHRRFRYLAQKYVRIIGGMVCRYSRYHWTRLRRQLGGNR